MNNAAPRRLYESEQLPKLAPVIPIKPSRKAFKKAEKKTVAVKTGAQTITQAPAFTAPVFKPKKHDML